ncbi:MAG TPA: bifunctional phosphoglucose/phosphomannose isomerase [Solirubrobacteraceae bacterium]|nr:bifunctional phosphoglucose/phosphomannose isomerase [Solirubrobacteraceae bacterium]
MAPLNRAAVTAVDSTGQVADILSLPDHLLDALWRVEAASLQPATTPGGLVIAGMGGSGVGGELARAALWPWLERPLELARGAELPAWTGPETLVLCSSYSGNTEETLAAYDAAGAAGAPRVVSASGGELPARARRDKVPVIPLPGGFQPRAAVGYSFVVALEVAAVAGAAPSLRADVEDAAPLARDLAAEWGPEGGEDSDAKRLARALHETIPVISGPGIGAAAAYRWKCQFNENAKIPAFAAELPEAGHNEIVGWESAASFAPFSAVFLEDPDVGDRMAARVGLTAEIVGGQAHTVERVAPRGETRLQRLVSHVLLGDLVSLYAAVLRGADPIGIEPIDRLKAGLAAR